VDDNAKILVEALLLVGLWVAAFCVILKIWCPPHHYKTADEILDDIRQETLFKRSVSVDANGYPVLREFWGNPNEGGHETTWVIEMGPFDLEARFEGYSIKATDNATVSIGAEPVRLKPAAAVSDAEVDGAE
jgi:hypothetical protein